MATVTITSLLLTLTFSYLSLKSSSLTPEQEKQTLLQIKNNFWGDPPSVQSWQDNDGNNNHKNSTTHCNWTGIYCSSDGFITNISLPNQNIHGEIPDSFADLSSLQQLDLSNNKLTGPIPAGIWMLLNLTTVLMNDNQLSGTLPEKLPWNISRLEIANNRFSGKLPSMAGNLQVFEANNNQFSGEIPANLAGFSRLQVLILGRNGISGEIPVAISELRNLNTLDLSDNRLSGEIPAAIGCMPVLTALDLSGNALTGEIPQAMGDLRLNSLNLSSNQLSGEVPQRLQNRAYERSFLANHGLCSSSTVLDLGACGRKSDGRAQISVLALIVFFGGYGLLSAAVFFFGGKSDVDPAALKLTSSGTEPGGLVGEGPLSSAPAPPQALRELECVQRTVGREEVVEAAAVAAVETGEPAENRVIVQNKYIFFIKTV